MRVGGQVSRHRLQNKESECAAASTCWFSRISLPSTHCWYVHEPPSPTVIRSNKTSSALVMGDSPEKKTIRLDSVQPTPCCLTTLMGSFVKRILTNFILCMKVRNNSMNTYSYEGVWGNCPILPSYPYKFDNFWTSFATNISHEC